MNRLPTPATRPARSLALDVFRGVDVAAMILVNHPGDPKHVWPPLLHAAWTGWTVADLVFPGFLFIVGVALTLALADRCGPPRAPLVRRIVRRATILFALGLFLNAVPRFDLSTLRIPGVLQRIALCYLATALLFLVSDVTGQAAAIVVLLGGYWMLLTWVPVPGAAAGVLEPGKNLAAWVDARLLAGHLGRGTWDPEGLLPTLAAVATTLMGVLAGHWLRGARSIAAKSLGLVIAGAATFVLGICLGRWLPVSKPLWTPAFAILTGGMSALLLGVCCWLVDVRGWRRPVAPFVVFGTNPIAVYVLATLTAKLLALVVVRQQTGAHASLLHVIYRRGFASWAGPTGGSLLFALVFVAVWFVPMTALYRRRIFIKI